MKLKIEFMNNYKNRKFCLLLLLLVVVAVAAVGKEPFT